jgi:hypothetical protein
MKKIKGILAICCALLLIFSGKQLTYAFSGEPTVIYDGRKKEFSFVNVQNMDLYRKFKNVVPGDVIRQKILLKAERINTPTEIYLDMEAVKGLKQTIYLQGKALQVTLEKIQIGRVSGDTDYEMMVVLEVPKELGNEIADLEKEVSWIFYAYELENENRTETMVSKGEVPKTGDDHFSIRYITMASAALLVIVVIRSRDKINTRKKK